MNDPINEPVDSGKSQALENDVNLQQNEDNKTASSPIITISPNSLTYTNQTGPPEKQISLQKKDEPTNIISLTTNTESSHVQNHKQALPVVIMQIILLTLLKKPGFLERSHYMWARNYPRLLYIVW